MRCAKRVRGYRSIGLGLMFSALACGGKTLDDAGAPPPPFRAPTASRATPASPPAASALPRPQPARMMQPAPSPASPSASQTAQAYPLPPPIGPYGDTPRAAAENVLQAYCGPCHGSALTPAQAQAGINFIDDTDKLAEVGLIVPLSSATSRIIEVMQDGSMPPPPSGVPPVTEADIQVVVSYIDNPLFWPNLPPPVIVDAGIETPPVDPVNPVDPVDPVDAGADGG